ncbi:MAG: hypothetical protein JNL21_15505 [Myxococcales bacterium]|nr:hypothetical protein [Myxococcales bacterium]
MNEYTRREEVRWILVSAVVLVVCVAGALGLLLSAKPSVVPDEEARAEAKALRARADAVARCPESAKDLRKELGLFREFSDTSGVLKEPEPDEPPPQNPRAPRPKPKPPEIAAPAWPGAKPTHERARAMLGCAEPATAVVPPEAKASTAWKGVEKAADVKAPGNDAAPSAQRTSAREVLTALESVDLGALEAHVTEASREAEAAAKLAEERAKGAVVEQPLPRGLLGREVAVAAGVLLSLLALLVSFFSLRATSLRRSRSLAPYRKATRPPERGLQAATILRLAAEPSGGEPGLVIGAGIGGVIAGLVGRTDPDWYVAGVTAGLLAGLLIQIVLRSAGQPKHFRERALALADIEKPAVPIVLVLSTVHPGAEEEFLSFFLKLSPSEAANAVEKLANQAEEQILAAADAQALG